jgi:N6-L-threonylcarbamoyladenine synthase
VILALETSCDDTCAALVARDGTIAANVISSQEVHARFGGVVPEVAARHHSELIDAVIDEAFARAGASLDDVTMVAATRGPGLVGALLVGWGVAKGIAAARELPFAGVDHLEGHIAAAYLAPARFEPPFIALIASGGHTLLLHVRERGAEPEVLARTLDDAAGEAFDKGARLLGLGYPGGAALSDLARRGDPRAHEFPTGRGEQFSFAGLKTALLYRSRELDMADERVRADLAASYERAIVEALARRAERALDRTGVGRLALGGGVAANGPLRERLAGLDAEVYAPPPELCTDNAAMIAAAALERPPLPYPEYLGLDVYATGEGPLR